MGLVWLGRLEFFGSISWAGACDCESKWRLQKLTDFLEKTTPIFKSRNWGHHKNWLKVVLCSTSVRFISPFSGYWNIAYGGDPLYVLYRQCFRCHLHFLHKVSYLYLYLPKKSVSFERGCHLGLLCWDWRSYAAIEDLMLRRRTNLIFNLIRMEKIKFCTQTFFLYRA